MGKRREKRARRDIAMEESSHTEVSSSFLKRLASNDKKIRDRGIRSLESFLAAKEDLSDGDILKLWKGIFYCFWMSDKTAVQQDLANRLSMTIPTLADKADLALRYFRGFLLTMSREWPGIDRLRMDKFFSLMRKFVRASLQLLQARQWHAQVLDKYMDIMMEIPFCWSTQNHAVGVQLHVADVFFDELVEVVPFDDMNPDTILRLAKPFLQCFRTCTEKLFLKRAEQAILHKLLRGWIEPKQEEALDEQKFSASSIKCRRGVCDSLRQALFDLASDKETEDQNRDALYGMFEEARVILAMLDDVIASLGRGHNDESKERAGGNRTPKTRKARLRKASHKFPLAVDASEILPASDSQMEVEPLHSEALNSPTNGNVKQCCKVDPMERESTKKKRQRKSLPEASEDSSPSNREDPPQSMSTSPQAMNSVSASSKGPGTDVYTPKAVKRQRKSISDTNSAKKSVAFCRVKLSSMKSNPQEAAQLAPQKPVLKSR